MATVLNSSSSFNIEQLTGERRLVRMVGRALPYRPFNLKTVQRVDATWLPGSPVATATVLGPGEEPSSVNGYWKDKFLGETIGVTAYGDSTLSSPLTADGTSVVTVRAAVELIDAIVREGQLVEVTWDNQTRHGLLTEFDKNWQNVHDLEWSMKFTWIGRGEPVGPSVFTNEFSISHIASATKRQLADLTSFAENPRFPVNLDFLKSVISKLQALSDIVDSIQTSVANMTAVALSPVNAARLAVATTTALVTGCADMIDTFNGQVAEALNWQTPLGSQPAQVSALAQLWVRGVVDRCRDLKYTAVDQRAILVKTVDSDIMATYTAKDGDDLRSVSLMFYGNANDWQRLMIYNGFTSAALNAGDLVIIPKVGT